MRENFSFNERPEPEVIGRGSETEKKEAQQEIAGRFGAGHLAQFSPEQLDKLRSVEREKTLAELRSIHAANLVSNRILQSFGLPQFDVPPDNVHFIDQEAWREIVGESSTSMVADVKRQAIFGGDDYEPEGNAPRALAIFEEVIHLKGRLVIEVDSAESHDLARSGLVTYPSYKKVDKYGYAVYFSGLNEAVVAEIRREWRAEVLRANPSLQAELEIADPDKAKALKEAFGRAHGVDPVEIEWINPEGTLAHYQPYPGQRKVLAYIAQEAVAAGFASSVEEVMRVCRRAHFQTSLLPIGRVVERTFGPGSFEILGTMDTEDGSESVGRVMNALAKRRRRGLRG